MPKLPPRLAPMLPFLASSLLLLIHVWRGWTRCSDTPCIALAMLVTVLAAPLVLAALCAGWFASSPKPGVRWTAWGLGALVVGLQIALALVR